MRIFNNPIFPSSLSVVLFFIMLSCGNDDMNNEAAEIDAAMVKLKTEIDATINATCTNGTVGVCKSIGFGTKACGGPLSYLIYSTSSTNEPVLVQKVEEYNALNKKWNEATNAVSDCLLITPPNLDCSQNQCAIVSPE
jgi:hypothetical protein